MFSGLRVAASILHTVVNLCSFANLRAIHILAVVLEGVVAIEPLLLCDFIVAVSAVIAAYIIIVTAVVLAAPIVVIAAFVVAAPIVTALLRVTIIVTA